MGDEPSFYYKVYDFSKNIFKSLQILLHKFSIMCQNFLKILQAIVQNLPDFLKITQNFSENFLHWRLLQFPFWFFFFLNSFAYFRKFSRFVKCVLKFAPNFIFNFCKISNNFSEIPFKISLKSPPNSSLVH